MLRTLTDTDVNNRSNDIKCKWRISYWCATFRRLGSTIYDDSEVLLGDWIPHHPLTSNVYLSNV